MTNVKVEEDETVLKTRQELVNTKTPSELAQMTSLSDIPVPSRLSRMVSRGQVASGSRSESRAKSTDFVGDTLSNATKSLRRENIYFCDFPKIFSVFQSFSQYLFSKININDMYATLPKSLTMELAVVTKVNKNQEEVERRKKLCQEKSPSQLGNIGSLTDLPIPAPIQNIFASKGEAPVKPKRKSPDLAEKRK